MDRRLLTLASMLTRTTLVASAVALTMLAASADAVAQPTDDAHPPQAEAGAPLAPLPPPPAPSPESATPLPSSPAPSTGDGGAEPRVEPSPEDKGATYTDPGAIPIDKSTLALDATLGLGSPRGFMGAGIEVLPMHLFSFHAGVGLASTSLAFEAGARARLLRRHGGAVGIGLGWSTNELAHMGGEFLVASRKAPPTYYFRHAHLVNLDVFGEFALGRAVIVRALMGAGFVANGGDAIWVNTLCKQSPCGNPPPLLVPYMALEVALPVL